MLISRSLLEAYLLGFNKIKEEEFINACNNLCMEIERVITHPFTNNLVVGKVLDVVNIEGSNKLHLANVKISNSKILQIICGAPNLMKDQLVVVAQENTILYNGKLIQAKEIMGYTSHGMICAYNELTPYFHELCSIEDQNGIIVLPNSLEIGDDAKTIHHALKLDDKIYELSFPTNREDYASALIVMQDLANYLNLKFAKSTLKNIKVKNLYQIKIKNVPINFAKTVIMDYASHDEDSWFIKSLLINNDCACVNQTINDITWASNLTGVAPLLFDTDKLPKSLTIRPAIENELISINSCAYFLKNNEIVITANDKVIAVDGFVVNNQYKVDHNTKKITLLFTDLPNSYKRKAVLKNNIFSPIAKYAKYQITEYQANLFVNELAKLGANLISSFKPSIEIRTKKINFDLSECNKFLGTNIDQKNILSLLKQMGLTYKNKFVLVPTYRSDLQNQYDIYEEVLKAYGINNLNSLPPSSNILMVKNKYDEYYFIEKIRNLLNNHFISEVKTYNLTSLENLTKFNIFNYMPIYKIDPCSNNSHAYLRLSLIKQMINVISYNLNHKNQIQPIFEIQKIYETKNHFNLTIIAPSQIWFDEINGSFINFNTFGLKYLLKQIEIIFNVKLELSFVKSTYLYDSDSLQITHNNQVIGYLGAIKSNLLKPYKITDSLYVLTLNFEDLINNYIPPSTQVKPILDNPHSIKDVTFVATEATRIIDINNELNKLDFINKYQYIKAYHMKDNKIAYSIRFYLINKNNQSLTKQEIDEDIKIITNIVENNQ